MKIMTGSRSSGTESRPNKIPSVVVHVDTLLGSLIWCHEDIARRDVRFAEEGNVEDRGFDVRAL